MVSEKKYTTHDPEAYNWGRESNINEQTRLYLQLYTELIDLKKNIWG